MSSYIIEAAKSSRSKCKSCEQMIEKGELRLGTALSKSDKNAPTGSKFHHLDCAEAALTEISATRAEDVTGFNLLEKDAAIQFKTAIKNAKTAA